LNGLNFVINICGEICKLHFGTVPIYTSVLCAQLVTVYAFILTPVGWCWKITHLCKC